MIVNSNLFRRAISFIPGIAIIALFAVSPIYAESASAVQKHTQANCIEGKKKGTCHFINMPLRLRPMKRGFFRTGDKLIFADSHGKQWLAPKNTITDGASIPEVFIPIIGSRTHKNYINAASVHDAYCGEENSHLPQHHSKSWQDTHRMLFDALLVNGTPEIMAKIMYAAVYLGGPRWNDNKRSLKKVSKKLLLQEMKWCQKWIKKSNPSQQRIEKWMKAREWKLQNGTPKEPNWAKLLNERAPE